MSTFFKILLIEDNSIDIFLITKVLTEMGLSEFISVCRNGEEALAYLNESYFSVKDQPQAAAARPELILLDIKMPVMDGFEFLRELQQIQKEGFPVVLLTSSSNLGDIKEAAELKVNYYITKPVTIEKMQKMIDRCFK